MKTWLRQQATLKSRSIGKPVAYVVANWDRLTRFVGDARVPLDNNAAERGIRGPVVGRKNHYGSKSRRGTEIAAIFYTLLETAKLAGVDPSRYLRAAALARARGEVLLPAGATTALAQLIRFSRFWRSSWRARAPFSQSSCPLPLC